MAYLKNLKKIGVNTTVLTTSLALAACGGGGGYYGDTNSNTNTNNPNDSGTVKEVAGVTIQLSKSTLKATGDTVEIIAKAVDKDGGGVSGKEINLNIKDSATNGATSDASTKTTGDDGTVKFTVTLDGSNKALTELLFTTTIVGTKIQNQSKATVTGAGTVVQSQYELKFDDITPLQVSGSEGAVRVRVLDNNGGGVPNENVSLTVKDFKNNNVTIKGASSAVTDNEGYVVFTLVLPKGKEADRAALIASGIALEATLTEQSGAIKTQISTAQVISVKNTMSSLTLSTSANNKIDAIGGTINVEVIAKNPEGLVVAGKDITLKLDDAAVEYGAKLANATVKTDENGKAIFTIKTEANSLNPTGQLLVNNGINITATSADGTVSSQVSKITVVSVATEDVSYLMAIGSNTIDVDNGEATVTVTAKDAKGGTVANKQINLTVPNSQNNGLTITNGSKITTDANGQAAFTLKFNKASVSANELNNLLANGVTVVASYNTVNSNTLTQTTRINFTNKNAVLEKDVQRIELTPTKGVVSAKNDTVQVKVRAISADGSFVANKSITLGLAPAVTENGVSVGGDKAVVKQTDASGYAIFTLNVDAFNQQSIDNLVKSGIAVAVSTTLADGSTVKQNTQIMVEAAPLQAVDVSYLSINPNSMINVKGGQTTVTVRAVDQNGGVLTDQDITLNIDQAQAYGLTIKNGSKAKTNAQGEAAFIVEYDGRTLDSAVLNELKTKGVLLTAKYQPTTGAAITQTSYVRYYEQSDNVEVKQLAISLGRGVVVASNDMFEVSVKAIDENGQPINGRKINLTLSDVAKNNGVKLVKPTELTVNGEAKFTVQLAAPNTDAVKALVDAGLLVTASVDNTNVSQTAKVMVVASNQGTVDVAYLAIEQLDAINVANNAERIVTVKAYNSSGIALTNKDIALSLSQSKGIRIKEGAVLTTNAAGEVKFTVVYDPTNLSKADQTKLLQDGLVIDAKYGNSVSQTVKLTYFETEVNIQRMDLVVDQPVLVVKAGVAQTVKATGTLKDDAGNVIQNRQVTVAINPEALQNGVSINGAIGGSMTVVTNASGQFTVDLTVQPKDGNTVAALIASGLGIGASALQADGSKIVQSTKVNILSQAALNEVSYLTTDSDNTISTTGGSTKITVKAFSANGIALSGKAVKLNLNNVPAGLKIQADAATKTTGADGTAQFIVTYIAPTSLTADQIKGLLAGVQAAATYTSDAGTNITQSTMLQFYVDQANIQRMDLVVDKSALVVNTTAAQTVKTTVTLKDRDGQAIKNRQVTLALNAEAVQNGVSFAGATGGLVVVSTDANGQAIIDLNVNPTTQTAVDALVASGVGIGASAIQADGSGTITQNIKVNILSAATQGEVAYLTSDSDRTIATTGGTSTITVKAFNSDGTALGGKTVKLNLNNVPAGLDVKVDAATKTTAADGTAQFTVTYTAPTVLTPEQIKALLAGIQALATYTNSAGKNTTQSTMLQFYADQVNIQRMDLVVEKGLALVVNTTTAQELLTTVTLKDKDGNLIKNRQVTVSLEDLGTDNNILFTSVNFKGVIGGSTVVSTDANGQAVVVLEVHPSTQKEVDALVTSGISIRASAVQGDGSGTVTQSLKINVLSEASQNEVAYLTSESDNTIATTGGSSIITVKAFSADNKALSGKVVKLNLNNVPEGVKIQVDQTSQTTDATGTAKFKVTYTAETSLTPVQIKALLAGIQATTTYTTSANKAITQNTVIQFYTDQVNIQRMDLVVDKSALVVNTTAAQTVKTTVTLKDRDGQAIKNRQVTLALNAEAVQNGVSFAGATGGLVVVSTDANGQAEIILSINPTSKEAVDALVSTGIGIGASAIQADGSGTITQNVKVNILSEASQNEVASLITESNNAIGTAGGTSTITVKTLNSDGKALSGKAVKLSLNNVPVGLDVKVDTTTKTTDAYGTAQFTVTYTAPTNLTPEQIKALLAGIQVNAVYTTSSNKNITQSTMLQFYVDQANIQRMDLVVDKAALVVNTTAAQTVKTTVTLKDRDGQAIKNRQVTLALNAEAVQNGVSFAGATGGLVVVPTDANGQAIIDLNVNPTTENAVNALIASGIGIIASAVQGDGSGSVTQNTKVSISSEAVGYMTVNSSGLIATTGGTSTITVKAFNSTGSALSGKTIQLELKNVPTGLDIKLDTASQATNGNGEATFKVTYTAPKVLTPEQIQGLLAGVQVVATYTNHMGINTTQNTTQQFAIDQVNIQRMDLVVEKPSLVMDTITPQTVKTTVTLKDKDGNLIKGRQVTLAIDNWGVDNNIIKNSVNFKDVIGGSTVVETDANGQAVVVLEVKTTTKEAVDTLAASGIGISASATQGDGSGTVTQTTRINVSSAATLSELSYLTLDNVNGAIKTTGGTTTLTVKAFNNKGTALAGKLIKLALNNIPAGLKIQADAATKTTGADGSANFTVTYTAPANLSAEQIKGLLAGVQATATYTSDAGTNVTQNTVLQFVADEAEVAKDAQRVELVTSKGVVTADNDTFTFTAKVFDKDGNPLQNKQVGFGLNAAATANGVTFVGGASTKTDVNGNATFTVNVKAGNDQMIENLVANGITLAASVVQADGSVLSQTIQVMVKAPVAKDVVALTTTLSEPVISVLGGTSIVAVKAEDANGNPLANKEINFGLAGGLSSRVKVDKTSATTNASGIAYFTVTVENGDSIDQLLVEKGITYAVSTYNNNSTTQPVVTQVGRVNVSVPTEAINLTMDKTKADLLASGDTSEVFAKLVDNTATGIKSYPVTFTVIDSALNGVMINGQETAVITTDTSGNAKVTLKLTKITGKQYEDLLANGVTVRASITLPNGVVRTQTVHFNVNEASSNYHLVFSNVSKSAMDVNGDRSIVTVTLLDRANQPVRNQEVTLAANNAGGLIIGNSGSSGSVNTSGGPVTVKTDSNGNAFFSVAIDGATVDKQLLLASGIELTATNTDEIGGKATQIYRILTVDNSGTPTVQPARYSLRIAAKPTMNVRDDTADVTVTLVDTNGGGVAGQYVTLSIDNLARNGAVIVGASGLTTDANGQAVFKIKVDENARRNYTATEFVNDDLRLTARFNETGYADATQISMIDIVQAAVQAPVASIVIGVNPTEVASSSDGVYYTKNMSVSVVDFDGKPLANQVVTLDSTPLTYIKGRNLWALAPKAGSDPAEKWVFGNQKYYNLSAPNIYLDANGRPMNNNGTPSDLTDDYMASTTTNSIHACVASPAGTAVGANNTPVKVVTFVSQSGAEQNTFTTDANGKFDFAMRYPKIYAQWLTVQIGASATVASLPNRTTYSLGLASLASDYSSDGTYSPNEVSPYGTSLTCP
ncbi:hypothetical protein [Acinetobacter parvus]|uniref:hypothetical protein n=1 Tax=Acinetobacter parvus TaxID=134533 RepID=UPI002FE148EF